MNCRFFGSQRNGSMLARKSKSLSGSVQSLPVFRNLHSCRVISEGFKSNTIPFHTEGCTHSVMQSIGEISVKAAHLKAKF